MVTISEARASLTAQKRAIEQRRKQIQSIKTPSLTRAEVQRQTRESLIQRQQQEQSLAQQKKQAIEQLKPYEQQIKEYESEISRVESQQVEINKRISDYQAGLKASESPIHPSSSKAFQEGQRAGRLKEYFITKSSGANIIKEIRAMGGEPIIKGGKLVGAEVGQMSISLPELQKGITINVPQKPDYTSLGQSFTTPFNLYSFEPQEKKSEVLIGPKLPTIQDTFQKERKKDVLTGFFSRQLTTVKQKSLSVELPTTRERVSGFFGVKVPRVKETFNILTGREREDPIQVKTVFQTPERVFTGVSSIFGFLGETSAKETKVEEISPKVKIPETKVPQKVTIGGEFTLKSQEFPLITVKDVSTGARIGSELGMFYFAGSSKIASGVLGIGFVSTGGEKVTKGKIGEGLVDVGIGTTLVGSSIFRTLTTPRKIIKDPVPKIKPKTQVEMESIITPEGTEKFILRGKTTTFIPERKGIAKSLLFDDPITVSKQQERLATLIAKGTSETIEQGVGVEARVSKYSKSRNIFEFGGKEKEIDLLDFGKLQSRQQKGLLGLREDKLLVVEEGQRLSTGEVLSSDLFKITPKKTKGTIEFNVKIPKPGKTITRETVVAKTEEVGKNIFGDRFLKSEVASIDITKSLKVKKPVISEVETIIRKPISFSNIDENIIKASQKLIKNKKGAEQFLDKVIKEVIPKITGRSKPRVISKPKPIETKPTSLLGIPRMVGGEGLTEEQLVKFKSTGPIQEEGFVNLSYVKPGSKQELSVTPIVSTSQSQIFTQLPKQETQLKVKSDLLQPQKTILTTLQSIKQIPITQQGFEQVSVTQQLPVTLQTTKQVSITQTKPPRLKYSERLPPLKPEIRIPISPKISKDPTTNKLMKLREQNKGVDVEVGLKLKKRKIIAKNVHPFTGLKIGRDYVDKNIEASFRLKQSKKKPKGNKTKPFMVGKKFRPSKTNPLFVVEKKKYRLDSPLEKKQIKKNKKLKTKLLKFK